ncbi:MAG: OmpA family protein [Akkermansia sp.]|nr:OmpA family protein [Akkermansia sp.]
MSSSYSTRSVDAVPERHQNRKRRGYELTRQRDMLPLALGAACAAIVLHVAIFLYAPSIILLPFSTVLDPQERVEDEIIRVFVKEKPEEEYAEAEDSEAPVDAPQEIEQIEQEPTEIDILDIEVEDLTMAPGETDLAVPEPINTPEEVTPISDMKPSELNLDEFAPAPMPEEALSMPEPTPVNSNVVVANAMAQPEDIQEASRLMDDELRRQAKEANSKLPGDTRSLAELMGVSNPGSKSGVARLGTDVLFAFNESRLKNSARIPMLQLAALVQKNLNTHFIIEGHTDSFGSVQYNALLSMQRAAAVREWLRGNGVPVENVHIRACGNMTPFVSTKGTRDQQALNRRVEIHMRKKDEKLPPGCAPHTYKVDLETPVSVQIASGITVPTTFSSFSAKQQTATTPAPAAKSGNQPNASIRSRLRNATGKGKKK